MTRKEANMNILDELKKLVEKYPDIRFHQLLIVSNISNGKDQFYEESEATLKRFLKYKEMLEKKQ